MQMRRCEGGVSIESGEWSLVAMQMVATLEATSATSTNECATSFHFNPRATMPLKADVKVLWAPIMMMTNSMRVAYRACRYVLIVVEQYMPTTATIIIISYSISPVNVAELVLSNITLREAFPDSLTSLVKRRDL